MIEASERLSPRTLVEWLSPSLGLDGEVTHGFRLSDCYRLSPSEPVRLELRRERERFEVDVTPTGENPRARMPATVAGLDLGYRQPAPVEPALAACTRIAELLRTRLGSSPRSWQVAEPSLTELADPVALELRHEACGLEDDPDAALLDRDVRSYAWLFGATPRSIEISVAGQPPAGVSLYYPPPSTDRTPSSAGIDVISLRVAHRRRMRRYFGALGFVFDDDAYLRTVPTPTTYARALAGRAGLARLRPRMLASVRSSLWHVKWALLVSRHVLPISVAPKHAVVRHGAASRLGLLARIQCDVGMLVHDMGVHAAALHAIPEPAWDELVGLAVERVRAQPFKLGGGEGELAKLAVFFEGSLTASAWRAWYEADEPEDFERCYAPHHRRLIDELREL